MIEIKNKEDCTGCFGCYNVCPQNAIAMVSDGEGFWYPKVDLNLCNNCGLCETVCPSLNKISVQNNPQAFACYNIDEFIRMKSSSGGVFTLVAEQILNSYNGAIFGAMFAEDFSVIHNFIETKEELCKLRGSKYVQSKIGDAYYRAKIFLEEGKHVLFTGTPCQIGGLKSFLRKDYEYLICLDIICHGVPSPKVLQKYISYRECRAGVPIRRIAFRRKNDGWKRYSVSFLYKNDTEYRKTLDKDLYMRAFLKDICLRPSCYYCDYKSVYRQSDITLADFWGIENILPDMDDDKGVSLVFVNSKKGELIYNQILDKLAWHAVDINEAVLFNSAATRSAAYNPKRQNFFAELDLLPFDVLVKKYCADSIGTRIKRIIRDGIKLVLKKLYLFENAKKIIMRN